MYSYIRFRWWQEVDLETYIKELDSDFDVKVTKYPVDKLTISITKDDRTELVAETDTLKAHISKFRAVLTQAEEGPFTDKDLKLRERILEKYPRNRPTPLPFQYSDEPKFKRAHV